MKNPVLIREGEIKDVPRLLALIRELAEFEKALDQVTNTIQMMEHDGFGDDPIFGCFVAEDTETHGVVGAAIYYWRYSTWKGRRIYLEDIIVTEHRRREGIGKRLFERTAEHALKSGATGMTWQVLDWNTPAIEFYKRYGASLDPEWINGNLSRSDLERICRDTSACS
jgi:GNAT superfamily N-acetyltransferase